MPCSRTRYGWLLAAVLAAAWFVAPARAQTDTTRAAPAAQHDTGAKKSVPEAQQGRSAPTDGAARGDSVPRTSAPQRPGTATREQAPALPQTQRTGTRALGTPRDTTSPRHTRAPSGQQREAQGQRRLEGSGAAPHAPQRAQQHTRHHEDTPAPSRTAVTHTAARADTAGSSAARQANAAAATDSGGAASRPLAGDGSGERTRVDVAARRRITAVDHEVQAARRTLDWLTKLLAVLAIFVVFHAALMWRRIRHLEQQLASPGPRVEATPSLVLLADAGGTAAETATVDGGSVLPVHEGPQTGIGAAPTPEEAADTGAPSPGTERLPQPAAASVEITPPVPEPPSHSVEASVSPEEMVRHVVATVAGAGSGPLPMAAALPWGCALVTDRGPVRPDNQDFGVAFTCGGDSVLVVADGVGGVPHGQRASRVAVEAAARCLAMHHRAGHPRIEPEALARSAVEAASLRLVDEGQKMGLTRIGDGLRTTLIVAVATDDVIGLAYIGDGGAVVQRASGELCPLLVPQKADPRVQNVLAASLGPVQQGDPVTARHKRQPGDLLIVGTDGVFDRVNVDQFSRLTLRYAISMQGRLHDCAAYLIDQLAGHVEDGGEHLFDDNLTLALCGDGSAPQLSAGFWSAAGAEMAGAGAAA